MIIHQSFPARWCCDYKIMFYSVTSPPQDSSVNRTQSSGRTSPPAASALLASSPALRLGALRAKSAALKDVPPAGFPPRGRALFTVTQTAALLMECCSASWPPAPTHSLRPAHPLEPCLCSVWKWSMSRTGTRPCQLSNRS